MISFRIPQTPEITMKIGEPCRVTIYQMDGTTVEFIQEVVNRQDDRPNGMMYLTLFAPKEDK
jgi:c-di-GMP-binding flagellar brake protein YcgR